ncbi:MAG: beta-hydroxyacyl-ACP dehydratase [Verrucomicrobiota bacterium]|nr:beta-hydroxyacyl-ACP dehydratase [Verrucomicrobiota bacterium]
MTTPESPGAADNEFLGLPHRPPFIFVHELLRCEPGRNAECAVTFAPDDPMFRGHFPGNPLVPGVILTEALAQTAGIAAAPAYPPATRPFFLLSAIRSVKFLRGVRPGEAVWLRAEKLAQVDDLVQFHVSAEVAGSLVAEGQLVLNVASNETRRA